MTTLTPLHAAQATTTSTVKTPQIDQPTRLSFDVVANTAGALRSHVNQISADVAESHKQSLEIQLEARTDEAAKRAPEQLLNELSDEGFSWTSIARLVGVSVPGVRKWRKGETVTGENRRKLAGVVAFVGILRRDHLIADVASWLDMPLADSSLNGIDVYTTGQIADLTEYAADHISGSQLLDRTIPEWRNSIDLTFEVFTADDGQRAMRMRPEHDG